MKTEEQARKSTLARLALGQALQDALLDVHTPEVAHQKLHWWREEIDRLHAGTARHPNTLACADLAGDATARGAALDVLGAAADERYTPAETTAALDTRLQRGSSGLLALCLASLEGQTVAQPDTSLVPLALGLAHHQRLQGLPRLLAADQAVFATELYQQHGIEPADLANDADPEAIHHLLDAAIEHALQHLDKGIVAAQTLWPRDTPSRAVLVLAKLRQHQLNAWRKRKTPLTQQRYALPPITKLWIAWRTR